jgi:hypothetical protein
MLSTRVEPNHGELDKITKHGNISRVVDISASQGHIVPTAITELFDGIFLISNLKTFPVVPGSSSLFAASKRGSFGELVSGFTTVLGLAVPNGRLYVLEMSNLLNGPAPGTGDIVSIDLFGRKKTVVSGLDFHAEPVRSRATAAAESQSRFSSCWGMHMCKPPSAILVASRIWDIQ